jgi:hypothetical protein
MYVFFCSLNYPACKAHAPCYIVTCGLSGLPCSYKFSHKQQDFPRGWERGVMNIKCLFWFSLQLLSETSVTLRRLQRGIITNVNRSSCIKYLLFLWHFNQTLDFLDAFSKNRRMPNFMEIRLVEAILRGRVKPPKRIGKRRSEQSSIPPDSVHRITKTCVRPTYSLNKKQKTTHTVHCFSVVSSSLPTGKHRDSNAKNNSKTGENKITHAHETFQPLFHITHVYSAVQKYITLCRGAAITQSV